MSCKEIVVRALQSDGRAALVCRWRDFEMWNTGMVEANMFYCDIPCEALRPHEPDSPLQVVVVGRRCALKHSLPPSITGVLRGVVLDFLGCCTIHELLITHREYSDPACSVPMILDSASWSAECARDS